MKSLIALAFAALCSLLIGCTTPSLNPLATPETTVTDKNLVGTWRDVESDDTTYIVTAAPDNAYQLKLIPKDTSKRTLEFSIKLCDLGKARFIDMTVTQASYDELGEKYGTTVVPAHVFMKMKRSGDDLTVWLLKNDWLNDGLKSGEHKLAHAVVRESPEDKDSYVLTGPTSELQTFFRNNAENDAAFEKPINFKRGANATADSEPAKPPEKDPAK